MQFKNESFSYYLTPDKNTEALIGLKQYFEDFIDEYLSTDYTNKNIPIDSRFIQSKIIGTLIFHLLQKKDIEYDKKTNEHIEFFKYYLNKCINNKQYCDNRIFLSCMQENLNLHLPKNDLIIQNIYTVDELKDYNTLNSDYKQKLELIYKNKDNIKYSKIYYCNTIEDLFICSLYELFEKKYIIRKCEFCGKFFVTSEKGNRVKYCYNISPVDSTKTCYVYKSRETTEKNRKNNSRIRIYRQITNRLRNRKDRTTDELERDYFDHKIDNLSRTLELFKKQIKNYEKSNKDLIDYLQDYNQNDLDNWKKELEEWREKNGSKGTNKKQKI